MSAEMARSTIDLVERRTLVAIRRAIGLLPRRIDREAAARALVARDWRALEDVVRRAGYIEHLARILTAASQRGAYAGARTAVVELRSELAIASRVATDWAREHAAELISHVSESVRQSVRAIVERGLDRGLTATWLQEQIAHVVPLLPRQVATLARLAEAGMEGPALVREAQRMQRARALMIARTEASLAVNRGRLGVLRERTQRVRWITADDEVVCPICEPLDGEVRDAGEEFDGDITAPPAHPNCRCTITQA